MCKILDLASETYTEDNGITLVFEIIEAPALSEILEAFLFLIP